MDHPDIECLQRMVEQLTKELEAALECFAAVDRRVRTLELARTVPPAAPDDSRLDSSSSDG